MYTCSSIVPCHMYFKYIKEFYSCTCILSHLLTNKRATMTPLTPLGGDDGLNCTNSTSNHVKRHTLCSSDLPGCPPLNVGLMLQRQRLVSLLINKNLQNKKHITVCSKIFLQHIWTIQFLIKIHILVPVKEVKLK